MREGEAIFLYACYLLIVTASRSGSCYFLLSHCRRKDDIPKSVEFLNWQMETK